MSPAALPPRRKQKLNLDWEELNLWLRWIFLLGIAAAFWLWGGCSPPAQLKRPIKSPANISTTYVVPDRCRILLKTATANVRVTIRRDCLKRGRTVVAFVVTNPANGGRAAGIDAGTIMLKFFGDPPELAPLAIVPTPLGPAFLFIVIGFSQQDRQRIRHDQRLRYRRH
ncbi:hypothetical protein LCGC14_0469060 [marine sediment metagenome]|uniref:Uncharacterized protein n=1 Tax=marine sediment metagenome TaxID=412755 RepID=A0A0F9SCW0_9ZZZZ